MNPDIPVMRTRIGADTTIRVPMSAVFHPVLLSGGSGTRLWPLSRKLLPKQFLALASGNTLFQDTALRPRGMPGAQAPIVICNDEHRFLAAEQLREHGIQVRVQILEPVGRNTAPAIAVVAMHVIEMQGDGVLAGAACDSRRGNFRPRREPVLLHPDRRKAPARELRPRSTLLGRSSVGLVSRRGRHRAHG